MRRSPGGQRQRQRGEVSVMRHRVRCHRRRGEEVTVGPPHYPAAPPCARGPPFRARRGGRTRRRCSPRSCSQRGRVHVGTLVYGARRSGPARQPHPRRPTGARYGATERSVPRAWRSRSRVYLPSRQGRAGLRARTAPLLAPRGLTAWDWTRLLLALHSACAAAPCMQLLGKARRRCAPPFPRPQRTASHCTS